MNVSKDYWAVKLPHPLSPSAEDVGLYRSQFLPGRVLLLGCTHSLIELSDNQMDIDPWYEAESVKVALWQDNKEYFENMIGDGVLNFTKESAEQVLSMASRHAARFIVRSFTRRLPQMKIAAHFPDVDDFSIRPNQCIAFPDYSFYIWDF